MKKKNNKGMTPFHFSLLYFIQQNVSSFIWFYWVFFRFVALFACVWKRSFSSSYFFYLVVLFVLFLIFFFVCLFCFVFVFFPFSFSFPFVFFSSYRFFCAIYFSVSISQSLFLKFCINTSMSD